MNAKLQKIVLIICMSFLSVNSFAETGSKMKKKMLSKTCRAVSKMYKNFEKVYDKLVEDAEDGIAMNIFESDQTVEDIFKVLKRSNSNVDSVYKVKYPDYELPPVENRFDGLADYCEAFGVGKKKDCKKKIKKLMLPLSKAIISAQWIMGDEDSSDYEFVNLVVFSSKNTTCAMRLKFALAVEGLGYTPYKKWSLR